MFLLRACIEGRKGNPLIARERVSWKSGGEEARQRELKLRFVARDYEVITRAILAMLLPPVISASKSCVVDPCRDSVFEKFVVKISIPLKTKVRTFVSVCSIDCNVLQNLL